MFTTYDWSEEDKKIFTVFGRMPREISALPAAKAVVTISVDSLIPRDAWRASNFRQRRSFSTGKGIIHVLFGMADTIDQRFMETKKIVLLSEGLKESRNFTRLNPPYEFAFRQNRYSPAGIYGLLLKFFTDSEVEFLGVSNIPFRPSTYRHSVGEVVKGCMEYIPGKGLHCIRDDYEGEDEISSTSTGESEL